MARVFVNFRHSLGVRVYKFNGSFDKSDVSTRRWCKKKHRHKETPQRRRVKRKLKEFEGVEHIHLCVSSLEVSFNTAIIRDDVIKFLDQHVEQILQNCFSKPELFTGIKSRNQSLVITILKK